MGTSSKQKAAEQLREMRAKRLAEEKAKQKRDRKILLGVFGGLLAVVAIVALIVFLCNRPKKDEIDLLSNTVKMTVSYTTELGQETTGEIVIELNEEQAPITVKNFKKLVSEGFYDGLTFHRVMSGFMIQGGDPDGDGTGGSPDTIVGEFSNNGHKNTISHTRGVISMARQGSSYNPSAYYNTASSQFFIVHEDSTFLDGDYAAFGEVIEGMDVVDGIAATEVVTSSSGENSVPVHPVTIIKIEFVD